MHFSSRHATCIRYNERERIAWWSLDTLIPWITMESWSSIPSYTGCMKREKIAWWQLMAARSRNTGSRWNPAIGAIIVATGLLGHVTSSSAHLGQQPAVSCNQRVSFWPFASVSKSESKLAALAFWGLFNCKDAFSLLSGTLFLPSRRYRPDVNLPSVKKFVILQH